ncbi:penicillin-binding protein 1C [Deltaproteobacteria bacterium Smac51]|nr:penicillin-binding protein 1C [Deltaproteobacteria bacterium Smac51]
MKKLFVICASIAGLLAAAPFLLWVFLGFFQNPLAEPGSWDWTVRVTDREGRLLKEFLPPGPARREALALEDFSPGLVKAVLAAEDKRFFSHPGVDPLAMIRAAGLNIRNGRIVSGGSTITMQLARMGRGLYPGPRTAGRKIREMWWALLIERHNSKEVILTEYLNRAPCGNLTEGFGAAARFYLNKPAADLSFSESAFLAALPASPGALNPYKDPRPALARRAVILERMAALGSISVEELARARVEPLNLNKLGSTFNAPHFVNRIRRDFGPEPPEVITTTLDLELQRKLEGLAEDTVENFRHLGLSQAAVVVMNLPKREVLAWVGSADFFNTPDGQNDGVTALRQPGSALKPFLYAVALEEGVITPASLLDDRPADFRALSGSFSPANYSGTFHGPVSARLALASSLNLPAVRLASAVGVSVLLDRFRALGLDSLNREADYYGLGLVLGGGEVDLLSLTGAYAALADGGRLLPPVTFFSAGREGLSRARQVFEPGTAFIISDILRDDRARATGFGPRGVLATPYPSSVKTGTSKNFRDNWCIGYTGDFVVGVWAGNFDADPMEKVSGVTGAGTLWRLAADLLAEAYPPDRFQPGPDILARKVCPASGLLAGPECPNTMREFFLAGRPLPHICRHAALNLETYAAPVIGEETAFGLIRPLNGEEYAFDPGLAEEVQHIKSLARSVPGVDELVWRLNGREIGRSKVSGSELKTCLVPVIRGRMALELAGFSNGREVRVSRVGFIVH